MWEESYNSFGSSLKINLLREMVTLHNCCVLCSFDNLKSWIEYLSHLSIPEFSGYHCIYIYLWFQANCLTLNVSNSKFKIFRNKNIHFDPENCKLKIGNEILERIGTHCTNKYLKFVGLKIYEFLNWDMFPIRLLAQFLLWIRVKTFYH